MGNRQATDPSNRSSSAGSAADPKLCGDGMQTESYEETERHKLDLDLGTDVDLSHLFHSENIHIIASKLWNFKGTVYKRCYWQFKEALEMREVPYNSLVDFSRFCHLVKSLNLTQVELLQIFNLLDYDGRGSFEVMPVLQALRKYKRIVQNDDLNLILKRFKNCSCMPGFVDVYVDQKDCFKQHGLNIVDFLLRSRLSTSALSCGVIELFDVTFRLRERIVRSRINSVQFSGPGSDEAVMSMLPLKAHAKPVLKKEDSLSGDDLLPVEMTEQRPQLPLDNDMPSGEALVLWYIQLVTSTARACHVLAPQLLNSAVAHTRAMASQLLPLSLCLGSHNRPSFLNVDCFREMTSLIQVFPEKGGLLDVLLSFHLACGNVSQILQCLLELNASPGQIDCSNLLSNIDKARKGLLEKNMQPLKMNLLGCDAEGAAVTEHPSSGPEANWKLLPFSMKPGERKVNFVFESSTWAEFMKIKIKVASDKSTSCFGFVFVLAEWSVDSDSNLTKELDRFSMYDNWSESDYKNRRSQRLIEKSCTTNEPVAFFFATRNRDEVNVVPDYPAIGKFVVVKFLDRSDAGDDHLGTVGFQFYGVRVTRGFSCLEQQIGHALLDAQPLESNQSAIQSVLRFLIFVFSCQGKRGESAAKETYCFSRCRYIKVDQKAGVLIYDPPGSDVHESGNVVAKMPFSKECPYFEIELMCWGTIVVGAVTRDYKRDELLGCNALSHGYHADDGSVFANGEYTENERKPCTAGDRMGCGVEFDDDTIKTVYFTKNGERIFASNAVHHSGGLFPAVGMHYFAQKVRLLSKKPWRFGDKPAEEVSLSADAGDFVNPDYIDLSNVTIESIWKMYKTLPEKMSQGLILQLLHSMLAQLKISTNNYKNSVEIFDHLCSLLDCKGEAEEDIITRNARDLIIDGLNLFFPCTKDRLQMFLDLLQNPYELSLTGSKVVIFQSLCQYLSTVDLNALMPMPTTPSQLPQEFDSCDLCALMEKLLSVSFHDSLELFQLTPGVKDSAAIHRSVSLGDQVLSGRKKSEHLLHLSKLLNQLQTRLFIWVCQQLQSTSPGGADDVDRLEKILIHYCGSLIAPKVEHFLSRMRLLQDSDLKVLLSQLDTSFLATTLRELVLLLCELSPELSPWLNAKLLETLKPVLMTIRKLLFKVPDLLSSLDENQGEKPKEKVLKSWEIDSPLTDRPAHFMETFSCIGATHFEVEFDKTCSTLFYMEFLEFTDSVAKLRFDSQVGRGNWPMFVRFEDTSAINFTCSNLSGEASTALYKFKVKALQTKVADVHWLYDLYISLCRLFGRISGCVLDKTPVLSKSVSSEADQLELQMYESELWTTIFRGGLISKKFERSLSGSCETEGQSDVAAFLNAVANLTSEKAKTFLKRCRGHPSSRDAIGGEEIDRVIASVFAALLWHTQLLRQDVNIYLRNEFDGKISDGICEAYASAENLRLFLAEKRQTLRRELEEEHEREVEEGEKGNDAVIDVVHLVEEKSKFLLQFAGLSKVALKEPEALKRKLASRRSRQLSVNRHFSHEPSIDLSISVESKYPSFHLVFDFVQDMAWTKDKVEDLLKKRHLKSESLWKTYSFISEFLRTISTEQLENDASCVVFLRELCAARGKFGRHYADGIDGCGLGMEAYVRSSYYGLLRHLVTILRGCRRASSDSSKPRELDVLAIGVLHLLDIDWQAYDLPVVAELCLPDLYFTLSEDYYHPSVCEESKEFGVDETEQEYHRNQELAKKAFRDIEAFRSRCKEADASLERQILARFQKLSSDIVYQCDGCQEAVSVDYYHCLDCPDFDICKTCYENEYIPDNQTHSAEHSLILFRYLCKGCNGFITGTRWRCNECNDFDLCNGCHNNDKFPEGSSHDFDHCVSTFPTPKVCQRKKPILLKDEMDAYFHLHGWLLFSGLARSVHDFLVSKTSEETIRKVDESYCLSAHRLYSMCLDRAAQYLIRQSSASDEVDSCRQPISPSEAEATDDGSALGDESFASKVIGLIAALIPPNDQNPAVKEATEILKSEKLLEALLNIARSKRLHDVVTRHMALGLLGKLLQLMDISSQASQSVTSSESGEVMIVDPKAVNLVQSLFTFGADCLQRHHLDLARSTGEVLTQLQSNPTWTRLIAHQFSLTVDLSRMSPSLSSIFALFVLTGFPEMLTLGTLVTHLETDKSIIQSVVRCKEPDEATCVIVELASRKKKRVKNNLLEVVFNNKSFLTESQVSQTIRLITDVVNEAVMPGLTLEGQSLWQLALLIKALLQSIHLSQSDKVSQQLLYGKSFLQSISHLASLGTGLSKDLLLRDLEILSLKLNHRSQMERGLTTEPEAVATAAEKDAAEDRNDADGSGIDAHHPVVLSSAQDDNDESKSKSTESDISLSINAEVDAATENVNVIAREAEHQTQKKHQGTHEDADVDTVAAMGRRISNLLNTELEIGVCVEEADAEKPRLLLTDGGEDEDAIRKRKEKSSSLVEKLSSSKEKGFLRKVSRALAVVYARQLLLSLASECPDDEAVQFFSADGRPECNGLSISILLLIICPQQDATREKIIAKLLSCCSPDDVVSIAVASSFFVAASENQEVTVWKHFPPSPLPPPPPDSSDATASSRVMDEVYLPGATALKVELDKSACARCDIDFIFSSSADFIQNRRCFSAASDFWTDFTIEGDHIYCTFRGPDLNAVPMVYRLKVTGIMSSYDDHFDVGYVTLNAILDRPEAVRLLPVGRLWRLLVGVTNRMTKLRRLKLIQLLLKLMSLQTRDCVYGELLVDLSLLKNLWQMYQQMMEVTTDSTDVQPALVLALTELFYVARNIAKEWNADDSFMAASVVTDDVALQE